MFVPDIDREIICIPFLAGSPSPVSKPAYRNTSMHPPAYRTGTPSSSYVKRKKRTRTRDHSIVL